MSADQSRVKRIGDAMERLQEVEARERSWEEPEPGRVPPLQCFVNARDALNRAFAYSGEYPGDVPYPFLTEALDWQRRGLEQLAQRQEEFERRRAQEAARRDRPVPGF